MTMNDGWERVIGGGVRSLSYECVLGCSSSVVRALQPDKIKVSRLHIFRCFDGISCYLLVMCVYGCVRAPWMCEFRGLFARTNRLIEPLSIYFHFLTRNNINIERLTAAAPYVCLHPNSMPAKNLKKWFKRFAPFRISSLIPSLPSDPHGIWSVSVLMIEIEWHVLLWKVCCSLLRFGSDGECWLWMRQ